MNLQVEEILKKHITTVNSFLDENGHNRFTECVEVLTSLIEQEKERAIREFLDFYVMENNIYGAEVGIIMLQLEQYLAESEGRNQI